MGRGSWFPVKDSKNKGICRRWLVRNTQGRFKVKDGMWIDRATAERNGVGAGPWHSNHPAPAFYQKTNKEANNQ